MIGSLPPAAVMILGALFVPLLRGRARTGWVLLLPVASLAALLSLGEGEFGQVSIFSYELTLVRIDGLSRIFGWLFHIAAFIGLIFARRGGSALEDASALVYAGAAIGAVQAGDLITLFVFWELLALSSVFLVWARRTERSYRAGIRYLIVQVGSGVILLAGIIAHARATGSVAFDHMGTETLGGKLILLGIGIKAAFPLLHNWLTDAYPEATYSGAVFLSAFTTKVAVYTLARGYQGEDLLIWVGVVMTMFPIFYAVIENDLRRVLGYSMINQIGFMVCGVGIGTEMAVNGAVAHAFNDVLFKGLLFMSTGALLYRTGTTKCSELGGLYKSMPKTAGLCIVGAASISAFPLFSGFVSKSMVMAAALEQNLDVVWLFLLFASAGVLHHAGIKIPFYGFFGPDSGIRTKEAPTTMLIAMGMAAFLCVFNGAFPTLFLYPNLPYEVTYVPFTSAHVISQLQLLFFAVLAFVWLRLSDREPHELPSTNLDADWFYRRFGRGLALAAGGVASRLRDAVAARSVAAAGSAIGSARRYMGPTGVWGRTWPTGTNVIWVAILLLVFLLLYYASTPVASVPPLP
ncbi:MAG: Na(+)/H(+) antiporter subunit D [Gemmatimonadales bacterium]|nr:Na(+)/H(+) antiporter subunit D [Gemmatimonadales bacterium]MYG18450.1 Na(+)/H(+) antiporter subunit D [Gemmatimonadales bacterium]